MASLLFWILVIVVSIVGGALLTAVPFLLYHFIKDFLIKRKLKIPKDKKQIKKFIEDNSELLAYNKNNETDEKEVKQDAENERRKFREFEKLRRIATKDSGVRSNQRLPPGAEESIRRQLLPNESLEEHADTDDGVKQYRKTVKLSD